MLAACASLHPDRNQNEAQKQQDEQRAVTPTQGAATSSPTEPAPGADKNTPTNEDPPEQCILFNLNCGNAAEWAQAFLMFVAAAFAVATLIATTKAANAAKASADALQNSQRAYVGIRYRQKANEWPEEFSFHKCSNKRTLANFGETCRRLHIRVINGGQTPARIQGGGIQCALENDVVRFDPITATFEKETTIAPNYLHAGGHYSEKLTYRLTDVEDKAANDGRLWLVGYLIYVDVFERQHRAGFCCRVGGGTDPKRNNLSVDETCKDYNYDYEIDEKGQRKPNREKARLRTWRRVVALRRRIGIFTPFSMLLPHRLVRERNTLDPFCALRHERLE